MDLCAPLSVVTPTVDGDVLRVLTCLHEPFTGRQIHQLVGQHSERGVRNTLNRLAETGIVLRQRAGAADLFCLNRAHLAAAHIIALANVREQFHQRLCEEVASWPLDATSLVVRASADLVEVTVTGAADPDLLADALSADLEDKVLGWLGTAARVTYTAGAVPEDPEDPEDPARDLAADLGAAGAEDVVPAAQRPVVLLL